MPYADPEDRRLKLTERYAADSDFKRDVLRRNAERKKRSREYVRSKLRPCEECGSTHRVQWHHPDGDGDGRELSRLLSNGASRERLDAEMARCQCLCQTCHLKHHRAIGTYG